MTKFSTRQDVVNKTLIRSLKKYYTQQFKTALKENTGDASKIRNYNKAIDKFVNENVVVVDDSNSDLLPQTKTKHRFRVDTTLMAEPHSKELVERIKILVRVIIQKPDREMEKLKSDQPSNLVKTDTPAWASAFKHTDAGYVRSLYKAFYECLYNYSHKKLEALIAYKEFCVLFADFYISKKFESLKNSDATLSKHKEVYETAAGNLADIILDVLNPRE